MENKVENLDLKIIDVAKKEFNEKTFKYATLRNIAKNADVTTGAIYRRYKNKDELFYLLCKDTIAAMDEFLSYKSWIKSSDSNFLQDLSYIKRSFEYNAQIVFDNIDGLELLFFKSQGSIYENYKDVLVEKYLETTSNWLPFVKGENDSSDKTKTILFRSLASLYISYIEQLILNKDNRKVIDIYIDKMSRIVFEAFKVI